MTQPVRTAPTLAEVAAVPACRAPRHRAPLNDSPCISEKTKARTRRPRKSILSPTLVAERSLSGARKSSPCS